MTARGARRAAGGAVRGAWRAWRVGRDSAAEPGVTDAQRLARRAIAGWQRGAVEQVHGRGCVLRWGLVAAGRALAGWAWVLRASKARLRAALRAAVLRRAACLRGAVRGWRAQAGGAGTAWPRCARRAWCLPYGPPRRAPALGGRRAPPPGVLNSPGGAGPVRRAPREGGAGALAAWLARALGRAAPREARARARTRFAADEVAFSTRAGARGVARAGARVA